MSESFDDGKIEVWLHGKKSAEVMCSSVPEEKQRQMAVEEDEG